MQTVPYDDLGPALTEVYFALKFCNCSSCGAELLGDDSENVRCARQVYRFDRPEPIPALVAGRVLAGCRHKPFCESCFLRRRVRLCDSLCALMHSGSHEFEWPKLYLKNRDRINHYDHDEDNPSFENVVRVIEQHYPTEMPPLEDPDIVEE